MTVGSREGVRKLGGRNIQVGKPKLNERQRKNHRDSVKVGQLLTLLDKNAHGRLKIPTGPKKGERYELSPSQVKSIDILLRVSLPALQAVDITTRNETPTLSPQELQQELGKLLRAMPESEIERLRRGDPALQVIEGEVIK